MAAEAKQYVYNHREITELLIKDLDLHEGLWGAYFEFNLTGANVGPDEEQLTPSAVVSITKVGIQRFDKPNILTLDASKINPAPSKKRARPQKRKK